MLLYYEMKVTPLAQCESCGKDVPPLNRNVIKSVPTGTGLIIMFSCPWCEVHGKLYLDAVEAKRRTKEIRKAEHDRVAAERIGREVKGMAVDLEVVSTVDDFLLYWNDQERFEPWSVPKEKVNSSGG